MPEEQAIKVWSHGNFVQIKGPPGFGSWTLNLPEKMGLDFQMCPAGKKAHKSTPEGILTVEYTQKGSVYPHDFKATYSVEKDVVRIETEVGNLSGKAWKVGGEIMACLRSKRCEEFKAPGDMSKTFGVYKGRLESITNVAKDAWGGRMPGMPSLLVRGAEETVANFKKGGAVFDDGPIIFVSTSGKRLVAFAWDDVRRVSMNHAYPCIHSNPRVTGLKVNERETRVGRIYFLEGTIEDFAKRYKADFGRELPPREPVLSEE
jgi:hypothetical protein